MSIRKVHHLNCGTMCPVGGFLLGQRGLGRGRHARCRTRDALFCAHDPVELDAFAPTAHR